MAFSLDMGLCRGFGRAGGRRRVARHLARFHQLLEAVKVAPRLHLGLALEQLRAEPAERPARGVIGKDPDGISNRTGGVTGKRGAVSAIYEGRRRTKKKKKKK